MRWHCSNLISINYAKTVPGQLLKLQNETFVNFNSSRTCPVSADVVDVVGGSVVVMLLLLLL